MVFLLDILGVVKICHLSSVYTCHSFMFGSWPINGPIKKIVQKISCYKQHLWGVKSFSCVEKAELFTNCVFFSLTGNALAYSSAYIQQRGLRLKIESTKSFAAPMTLVVEYRLEKWEYINAHLFIFKLWMGHGVRCGFGRVKRIVTL